MRLCLKSKIQTIKNLCIHFTKIMLLVGSLPQRLINIMEQLFLFATHSSLTRKTHLAELRRYLCDQ